MENYNGTVAAGGVVTGIAGFAIISETAITVLRLVYVCRKQTKFLFMLVRSSFKNVSSKHVCKHYLCMSSDLIMHE